jgi:hypothetical protein
MNEQVFRTQTFTKQVRIFLRQAKRPVDREEIYEVFGRDRKTRKKIYSSLSNLMAQGDVARSGDSAFIYTSKDPIPGEQADRVWEFFRINATFTAADCAKFTGVSREYVQALIRLYVQKGYVELVDLKYSNTDRRVYRLKDRTILIRPSSEK